MNDVETLRSITRICGVDFSGASDAGRRIWISTGVAKDGKLQIEECGSAYSLPGSGRGLKQCIIALLRLVRSQRSCAFGFDFPFSLPTSLVRERRWEDFVLSFSNRYSSPDQFRKVCHEAAGGSELKRITDVQRSTPFSPYNLRMYRQTYFGIRDVLGPLIRQRVARVLPMQKPASGLPLILEVCPASTLKRENMCAPYKGKGQERRSARLRVLRKLMMRNLLVPSMKIRSILINNTSGDALDSVVAAFATFKALRASPEEVAKHPAFLLEGYVYT